MLPAVSQTITVVSCHFGDPIWITHMCQQLDELSDGRIEEIVIVDQSRNSREVLEELPRVSQVLSFPIDEDEIALVGHDHPASLNRALGSIEFTTSHVLVLDSDCFPIAPGWLDLLHDVTLASDPRYGSLSHPCFLLLPSAVAHQLDFSEGMQSIQMDTGRLVATQVARLGLDVQFTRPVPAFDGYRGHFLLDRHIYHHGSASFSSSPDPRLNAQLDRTNEIRFRELALQGDFELSRRDVWELKAQGLRRALVQLKSGQ